MIKREEIKSLTGLRGVAAFMVMLYHFKFSNFFPSPINTAINSTYLAVDLFFILSGFVMALTYSHLFQNGFNIPSYKRFILLRIARIYPIYFITTLLTIILFILFPSNNDFHHPITAFHVTLNMTMTQAWGFSRSYLIPAWSISTEFAAYLVFPFLLHHLLSGSFKKSASIGFALFFSIFILSLIPDSMIFLGKKGDPMNIWNEYSFGPLMRCLLEFSIGIICYRIFSAKDIIQKVQHPYVSLITSISILCLLSIKGADFLVIALFPVLILSLTNAQSAVSKTLSSWPCYQLGLISYSLYLIHHMTYFIKPQIMDFIHTYHIPHDYLVAIIIQTLISIILAYASYLLIEKPGRSLLRKVWS